MKHALYIAQQALYIASPNPMVGAVIVKDGEVIGEGYTHSPGQDHAEVDAIKCVKKRFKDSAKEKLSGSNLYVTLEPCSKKGRTPACIKEIVEAGIEKVFIATEDPSQEGISSLRKAGIETKVGLYKEKAQELNKGFFMRIKENRPYVRCKIACSLDGGIALSNGESKWITSSESRLDVHKLRAASDAILTGIGTVLTDNPRMTVRINIRKINNLIKQPKRYVVDSQLKLNGNENLIVDNFETTIFCNKKRIVPYLNPSIKILEAPGKLNKVSLQKVMDHLNEEMCNYLMIESGPKLITSLIEQQLIDEFIFYIAPKLLGKNKIHFTQIESSLANLGTIRLEIQEIKRSGPDFKLVAKSNYH